MQAHALPGAWAQQRACGHTREYSGSKACSASISAATPPCRCTSAMACSASVVFPLLSGPYTCGAQILDDSMQTTKGPHTDTMYRVNCKEARQETCLNDAASGVAAP